MEKWKDIPGWKGWYQISTLGRVRSVDRTIHFSDGRVRFFKGQIRRLYADDYGYPKVTLNRNGTDFRVHLHVLVALAFIGPCPKGKIVLHKDGDPTNCTPGNIRYGTHKQNSADSWKHGTRRYGEKHHMAHLSDEVVTQIKVLRGKIKGRVLAEMFGTSPSHVSAIQHGTRRIHHK